MSAMDAIRADIADLGDTLAGINARREQIVPEINEHHQAIVALEEERRQCLRDEVAATHAIQRLERALALLSEQEAPEIAEPVEDPVARRKAEREERRARRTAEHMEDLRSREPGAISQTQQRVRDDLHDSSRARIECEPAPRHNVAPRGGDALTVLPRSGAHPTKREGGITRASIEDGGYLGSKLDMNDLSQTDAARADFVAEVLSGGEASGLELRDVVMEQFGCDNPGTAQTIVGRALAVLYNQDRAKPTGEKAPGIDGKRRSPVWKLTD